MGHSRTVVLVDTNEIVRRGLCSLLHSEPALRVIAEAATAGDGMAHVTRFVPDVLVMDPVTLPDAGGFDMCRRIRAQAPGVRVVMLVERVSAREWPARPSLTTPTQETAATKCDNCKGSSGPQPSGAREGACMRCTARCAGVTSCTRHGGECAATRAQRGLIG